MVRSHRRCVNFTSIVPGHQKARVHHQVRVLSLPILHADRVWTASAPQVPSTATRGDGHVGVDAATSPRRRCACPEIAQRPRHPSACCHTLKPPLHRALQHPSNLLLLTRVVFALRVCCSTSPVTRSSSTRPTRRLHCGAAGAAPLIADFDLYLSRVCGRPGVAHGQAGRAAEHAGRVVGTASAAEPAPPTAGTAWDARVTVPRPLVAPGGCRVEVAAVQCMEGASEGEEKPPACGVRVRSVLYYSARMLSIRA